jgi:hypothetical protein
LNEFVVVVKTIDVGSEGEVETVGAIEKGEIGLDE